MPLPLPLPLCACGADGEQQHGQWFGLDPEELLAFNHAEEAAGVAAATEEKVGVRKTSSLVPFCSQNDHFTNTGSGQT